MTLSVTPKTITIANGTANDGSVVNTMFTDCYTNDSTIASYVNAHCALVDSAQTFTLTQTFTAKPVSTKGIGLSQASEPTSPVAGDYWYSATNNQFEGLVQVATISGATNASPIVITTGSAHGLGTGQTVYISGVLGNTAANGSFTITVTGPTTFSLDTSTGNGAYTSGGTVSTIQTIKQGAPIVSVSSISSNPTANVTDKGKLYVCTSTFTFGLTAAAVLGSAWYCYIRNDGTGIITIDPNSTETINGKTTLSLTQGQSGTIVCDGSNFKFIGGPQPGQWALIQEQTLSGASSADFTVGFEDGYDHMWVVSGLTVGTDNTTLNTRVSIDGTTFRSTAGDYEGENVEILTVNVSASSFAASTSMPINTDTSTNQIGNAAGESGGFFEVTLVRPDDNTIASKEFAWRGNYRRAADGGFVYTFGGGRYKGTSDKILGMRFYMSSGTFTALIQHYRRLRK